MEYTLEFAPDAMANLATLEPWLQELALDLVEWAIENGEKLVVRGLRPGAIVDLARDVGNVRHYIFVIIDVDHAARHLKVTQFIAYTEALS